MKGDGRRCQEGCKPIVWDQKLETGRLEERMEEETWKGQGSRHRLLQFNLRVQTVENLKTFYSSMTPAHRLTQTVIRVLRTSTVGARNIDTDEVFF